MLRRGGGTGIRAALAALLLSAVPASAQTPSTISAEVTSNTVSQPLPNGFLGISSEYTGLHAYTGSDPHAVDPVFVRLFRALAPGQTPVLRVGGNSTDHTWSPIRKVVPPPGIYYKLTSDWLQTTHALATVANARLIMGVNLAANRPSFAAAEARAFLQGIGRRYITAFEIGNEPDLYGLFVYYRDHRGKSHTARPHSYNLNAFIKEFSHWRAALPVWPVAGPAFAGLDWMKGLQQFLDAEPHLSLVTFHRYPLRACQHNPNASDYPSIPSLLSDQSSQGLAQVVAPFVSEVHAHGIPFRLDELNSASCRGKHGVSDTFASALWAIDALFNLAAVGVDGVNVHTLPGAAYELFTVTHQGGWHGFVHPDYYGLMVFEQAFPPGAQLLSVNAPSSAVKVWATQAPDGKLRVVLINKDPNVTVQVQLKLPGAQKPATAQALTAPTLSSRSSVSFNGQSFNSTGTLTGTPAPFTVSPALGSYSFSLPAASALLLTK